jgi:hypothetical protein
MVPESIQGRRTAKPDAGAVAAGTSQSGATAGLESYLIADGLHK